MSSSRRGRASGLSGSESPCPCLSRVLGDDGERMWMALYSSWSMHRPSASTSSLPPTAKTECLMGARRLLGGSKPVLELDELDGGLPSGE